jgi:F-type H+-transporting ATPase subunit epsilon
MFQLSIVTPTGKVFEESVESVVLPGLEGGLEVYSHHMPILYALKEGFVRVKKEGHDIKSFKIDSGVVEVNAKHDVLVLADQILEDSSATVK